MTGGAAYGILIPACKALRAAPVGEYDGVTDRLGTAVRVRWRCACVASSPFGNDTLAMLALMGFAAAAPATAGCDDDERPATPISLKANPLGSGGIMLQWSSNVGHYDIAIRDKQGRPVPEAPDIVGGATNENYHEFYGLAARQGVLLFHARPHRRRHARMHLEERVRNGQRQDGYCRLEQNLQQLRSDGDGRNPGDERQAVSAPWQSVCRQLGNQ